MLESGEFGLVRLRLQVVVVQHLLYDMETVGRTRKLFDLILLSLGLGDQVGRHVLLGVFIPTVPGAEDVVAQAPIQAVVAVPVVVMFHVVVQVQGAGVVGQQGVDGGQVAQHRDQQRVHGVDQGDEEVTHGALQHGLEGVDSVLSEG